MKSIQQIRKLFVFDFICAFLGAAIYYLLFDFIVDTLSLPASLLWVQMAANFLYGIYGVLLYLSRTERMKFFNFLIAMNFIYAFLCVVGALKLSLNKVYLGAGLLLFEAVIIAVLAKFEIKFVRPTT